MKRWNKKITLFFTSLICLTLLGVLLVGQGILFGEEEIIPWVWLAGFGILFTNVVYLFVLACTSLILKHQCLPEAPITSIPKTALCYFIRHEDTDLLFERIRWSFKGNCLENVDLWILSDSETSYETEELRLFERLRLIYGSRVHYRRRIKAVERKQGNIREFVLNHREYEFLYLCDADSSVPEGTLLKLLRKALHPAHQDVAVFQTFIRTANAKTFYARFEGVASETSQELYFKSLQALFGQAISFGHHCLARRELLEKINLPTGLLSHDNWDTALLDQLGYRTVFAADVMTFDEAPVNYHETRKREARWAHGTLQGWPLVFMRGLSPGVRFLSFYGIYCYLAQPVFLVWVLLGLLAQSFQWGELLSFGTNAIIFDRFANKTVYAVLVFSLAVIFFHKLAIVRSRDDLKKFIYEFFFSTLIYSGNFLYLTIDLLMLPVKKLVWLPMRKNPFEGITLTETVQTLLPGTILGFLGLWYLWQGSPYPKYSAMPLLISFVLAIPTVYLSAKTMPEKETFQ